MTQDEPLSDAQLALAVELRQLARYHGQLGHALNERILSRGADALESAEAELAAYRAARQGSLPRGDLPKPPSTTFQERVRKMSTEIDTSKLPSIGDKFWWFPDSRQALTLKCQGMVGNQIAFVWELYDGYMKGNHGAITWTMDEWRAAIVYKFKEAVKESDLKEDEQLCRICQGRYMERERDGELMFCAWCDEGRQKKPIEVESKTTRRSPLHPEVPRRQDA